MRSIRENPRVIRACNIWSIVSFFVSILFACLFGFYAFANPDCCDMSVKPKYLQRECWAAQNCHHPKRFDNIEATNMTEAFHVVFITSFVLVCLSAVSATIHILGMAIKNQKV